MNIRAGFDIHDQLVVCIDFENYRKPQNNCSTAVVVNRDDSEAMAIRHHVGHSELPAFIAECMEEWREIDRASLSKVKDCFKEITECLLDEGCRFKIVRTYGRDGSVCC